MKIHISPAKASVLALLILSTMVALFYVAGRGPSQNRSRTSAQVREEYGQLPLSFEVNCGQADASVNFLARGFGYTLALAPTEAVFALSAHVPGVSSLPPSAILRMNLVGANERATVAGAKALEGKVNYLIGNDPDRWRTNIPTFRRVHYSEVYPGIDLVYYGNQRQLEYDFVIAPGREARAIALEFKGAERVEIEETTGELLVTIGEKTIRQQKPLGYQETRSGRREVETRYALREGGRIGFDVGKYDRSAPLIIDPVLIYSTYLGGDGGEQALDVAIDSTGSAYVTGSTGSTNFPTANAIQSTNGGGSSDAFVTKLNAAGSAFVYSTYLGGSAADQARGIAVDSSGNAYVTGYTSSANFPTANAFQATKGATGDDAFVTKLNAAGSALVYSTYLGGGNNSEIGQAVAVDSSGNAYITGVTASTDFPVVNSIQSTKGGSSDGFVTKINTAGSALVYSTYLGGSGSDGSVAIAVDSSGSAYVTGNTTSSNFPIANAFQAVSGGQIDAFVAKLNAAGSAFVYSSYLGGSDVEGGTDIALDSAGNAYLTGLTVSGNFPTANAIQPAHGGGQDAFVTKVNATGSALVYSTYLGGTSTDIGTALAVDASGSAYIAGHTSSNNFPTANSIQCARAGSGSDVFVTRLNAAGSALLYSTFIGGSGDEEAQGIKVDSSGNAYVVGATRSSDFPVLNPIQGTYGGDTTPGDGFVFKLNDGNGPTCVSSPSPTPSQLFNISTRARVQTDDHVMIGGFIITGNASKPVVVRALGPSLTGSSLPAASLLADPVLSLYGPNGEFIARNDNWRDDQRPLIEGTIYQPTDDRESVIVATLAPKAYTAIVMGKDRTSGIGTVEVYDNGAGADSQLANISTRGFVADGDNLIIGGFILGGNGPGPRRVVIRALGPSLAGFGITDPLQDPFLELKNENGTTLLTNDNWQQTQATEIAATGLAPTDIRESALLTTLPSGRYFAMVQGKTGATGVAIVEIYGLP